MIASLSLVGIPSGTYPLLSEPLFGNSYVETKDVCLYSVFSTKIILPLVKFGFTSSECSSFSYFCFSNIVGFISTPMFEFLSLNVERAGTTDFIPSTIE
jgi:hypothetical protein